MLYDLQFVCRLGGNHEKRLLTLLSLAAEQGQKAAFHWQNCH